MGPPRPYNCSLRGKGRAVRRIASGPALGVLRRRIPICVVQRHRNRRRGSLAFGSAGMLFSSNLLPTCAPHLPPGSPGRSCAQLRGCSTPAPSLVPHPSSLSPAPRRVRERHNTYNNDSTVSQSWALSAAKLAYYHAFAQLYGLVGAFASAVMVNSSWTRRHISEVGGSAQRSRSEGAQRSAVGVRWVVAHSAAGVGWSVAHSASVGKWVAAHGAAGLRWVVARSAAGVMWWQRIARQ